MRQWNDGETLHDIVDRIPFGKNGLLRTYEPEDRDALLDAITDTEPIDATWVQSLKSDPVRRRQNVEARTTMRGRTDTMGKLGIFLGNRLVGEIGWTLGHPRAVKLEVWIRSDARNGGVAKAALTAFMDAVRKGGADPDAFLAQVRPANEKSQALVASLGFTGSAPVGDDPALPWEWYLWEPGRARTP
jgi:RimJ/RimL family protein N-acetyltransferase